MPLVRRQLASADSGPWDLVFLDDSLAGTDVNGHRVLRYGDWLDAPADIRCVAIAIANSRVREQLAARCTSDGVGHLDVRAANVEVLDDVAIGPGAILAPFVTITSNVRIGRQFHANIYSYVAHDCVIGDCVTEINVTSPTGFQEITTQTGFDVARMFVDALERLVGKA